METNWACRLRCVPKALRESPRGGGGKLNGCNIGFINKDEFVGFGNFETGICSKQ